LGCHRKQKNSSFEKHITSQEEHDETAAIPPLDTLELQTGLEEVIKVEQELVHQMYYASFSAFQKVYTAATFHTEVPPTNAALRGLNFQNRDTSMLDRLEQMKANFLEANTQQRTFQLQYVRPSPTTPICGPVSMGCEEWLTPNRQTPKIRPFARAQKSRATKRLAHKRKRAIVDHQGTAELDGTANNSRLLNCRWPCSSLPRPIYLFDGPVSHG
jgi:hypothetical protein